MLGVFWWIWLLNMNWFLRQANLVHVAEGGISKLALVWKPAMQGAYVEELERNTVMLHQFDEAIVEKKVETASFCLSALIAQASGN